MKKQATALVAGGEYCLTKIKHTQALEFICRHLYGYPSWNVACSSSSPDHTFDLTYTDCLQLVGVLANTLPVLQITEEDLALSESGDPCVMDSTRYRKATIILGSVLSENEPSGEVWEEYLVSRFVDKAQAGKMIFGWEPGSAEEWLHVCAISLEYKQHEIGNYPWDQWEKIELAKNELSADLISLGRSVYRECYQHGWNRELQLFCGWIDGGKTLSAIFRKWPDKAETVVTYLMDTDAGSA